MIMTVQAPLIPETGDGFLEYRGIFCDTE